MVAGGALPQALSVQRPIIVHVWDAKPDNLETFAIDEVSKACRNSGAAAVLCSPKLLKAFVEEQELAIARFPHPVKHLPLSEAQNWMATLNEVLPQAGPIVVLCHAGIRSWNFGCWLLEQQPERDVWNLEGGIDAWSVTVDAAVPRY